VLLEPAFLERLGSLSIAARRLFSGRMRGERRTKKRGISIEFADYRDYVPGDDIRFIDWNLAARLGRLFLKLFLEEEDLHLYVLVDCSTSMGYGDPTKLDFARRIAAAAAYVALFSMERAAVCAFGENLTSHFGPARGRREYARVEEFLSALSPGGRTSLAKACKSVAMRFRRRGVAVVVSDLLDPAGYESGLRSLLGRGMEVHVVHVLSPEEAEPELAGELRLIDCETEASTELTAGEPLLRTYLARLQGFIEGAKEFCSARGMGYLFARSDARVEDVVMGDLRRGGLFK